MSRIALRPCTIADMLQAKAAFMAERERQKNDKKRTKHKRHKDIGEQGNTGDLSLSKG